MKGGSRIGNLISASLPKMNEQQKLKELARLLCKWNRRELDARDFANKVWDLFQKEARETWNDPLEKLIDDEKDKTTHKR